MGAQPVIRGIIPAFAGNTVIMLYFDKLSKDHPRIRGEHDFVKKPIRKRQGSSPHSRGTLAWENTDILPSGIIPAFAGNTIEGTRDIIARWDHPRIRGEHMFRILLI